jgi:hemoglobin-like flavoprotein
MNETELRLVRASFGRLQTNSDIVALIFFQQLFALAPTLQPRLRMDVELHGARLFAVLERVLAVIHDPAELSVLVGKMAANPKSVLSAQDWREFSKAWLWTIREVFASEATPGLMNAWNWVFEEIGRGLTSTVAATSLWGTDTTLP